MRAVILYLACFAVLAFANDAVVNEPVVPVPQPVVPSTPSPATATPVCNEAEIKSLVSSVAALKSASDAQTKTIASLPDTLSKLSSAVEAHSTKLAAASSSPSSATATVDLAPVVAAVEAVQTKLQALASADAESDKSEDAALSKVAADVATIKSSVGNVGSEVKEAVTKLHLASRFEALDKELASLKALVQQLVDSSSSKSKKDDNGQIAQMLENQAEILKMFRQANEPIDWKGHAANATQVVAKFARTAFDFAVQKGSLAWASFVDYVKHIQSNPPDFKRWQSDALKFQSQVAEFAQAQGVPKDKASLAANVILGLGAVIVLFITLTIIVKFVRCICCCGRKSKKSNKDVPNAPPMESKLKEEADEPVATPSSSSSGAGRRKGKNKVEA